MREPVEALLQHREAQGLTAANIARLTFLIVGAISVPITSPTLSDGLVTAVLIVILPVGRRVVEAHGGRLEVESTPGQGAPFTIALPAQAAVAIGDRNTALKSSSS